MFTRATVAEQLTLYHARLDRALDGISDEEARRVFDGGLAPIVWQVGHLAVADATYTHRGGGSYALPARYTDLFEPGTGGEADYPPVREAWRVFSGAHEALLKLTGEADLAKPLEHPAGAYTSVGGMLIYACYHRGYHIGKIGTLRALLAKPLPVVPPAIR